MGNFFWILGAKDPYNSTRRIFGPFGVHWTEIAAFWRFLRGFYTPHPPNPPKHISISSKYIPNDYRRCHNISTDSGYEVVKVSGVGESQPLVGPEIITSSLSGQLIVCLH